MNKKKVLKILTVIEVVAVIITMIIYWNLFDAALGETLNAMTDKWIGKEVIEVNNKKVEILSILALISTIILVVANIVRLFLIKKKYRITFIIGFIMWILSISIYLTNPMSTIVSIASLSLFIGALWGILYSHKIGTEYDNIENIQGREIKD